MSQHFGASHVLVRSRRIQLTGVWFRPAWWREEPAYQCEDVCPRHEANLAFEALISVFSDKWYKSEHARNHPLESTLHAKGRLPFVELLGVGRALRLVREKGVFERLEKRLRRPEEFSGAQWELEIQAELIRKACIIQPWPKQKTGPKCKNFEFICSYKKQNINLEIKHLKWDTVSSRVPWGVEIDVDAILAPLCRNQFKNVARKLQEIEGHEPNVLILSLPLILHGIGTTVEEILCSNTRLRRLSELFIICPELNSSGENCNVLHIRSSKASVDHVSHDFIQMMRTVFQHSHGNTPR